MGLLTEDQLRWLIRLLRADIDSEPFKHEHLWSGDQLPEESR